jgi:hypothetical protein
VTKVVFIGGIGRSGSTLLDVLLGHLPGFFSSGELKYVWDRGLGDNQLCGCGAPFRACPFWQEVGERAFGGWDRLGAEEIAGFRTPSIATTRQLPLVLAPGLSRDYALRADAYASAMGKLYRAVAAAAGARVVVDSSKSAGHAFLLRRIPGIDGRVVQLLRDSRGVAYSWSKTVVRPEVVGETAYMGRFTASQAGRSWIVQNVPFHALRVVGVPKLTVRYEELVASPRRELERILAFVGEPAGAGVLDFLRESAVELLPNHTLSGNAMRFERGSLELRLDDEWRRRLGRGDRLRVLGLTWPLMTAYGYLPSRRGTQRGSDPSPAPTSTGAQPTPDHGRPSGA